MVHFRLKFFRIKDNFMPAEIAEKVREAALQIIGEKKYFLDIDISNRTGISPDSAALYLDRNYKKWGLVRGNIHRNPDSQQRLAYAKTSNDLPLRSYEAPAQIRNRLEIARRRLDKIYSAKKVKKPSKQKPKKINLSKWIIDLHEEKGRLTFNSVMTLFRTKFASHYGRRINTENENNLTYTYRRLVNKGKLVFEKEDGTTYLPNQ